MKQHEDRLLETLKIFTDAPYYPFRFYTILITQSIHRFTERNETSALFEAMRRLATGTNGVFYLYHFLRSLLSIDVDMASFSEGLVRLKAAGAHGADQRRSWFDWFQTLSSAAMLCLSDPERFESFQSILEQILEYQCCIPDKEERKAVRYGIINEVMTVASTVESAEVRKKAMFELQHLAVCRSLSEGWYADPEVYEGLLDASSRVYQQGEFCPKYEGSAHSVDAI